jgi:hypothetical protein
VEELHARGDLEDVFFDCERALGETQGDNPEVRAHERTELSWWSDRAYSALRLR